MCAPVLADAFLENSEINDQDVLAALKSCIWQRDSDDQRVSLLVRVLERCKVDAIGFHENADDIWINGLRIIHQSVGTHSSDYSNGQNYLKFAVSFVKVATNICIYVI